MGLLDRVLGDDGVLVRQYLATVIGPLRAPFGRRRSQILIPGGTFQLALNKTTDRVLFVTVSRADLAAGQSSAIFSQSDGPSTNDFFVQFPGTGVFRFTLRPGEQLSILNLQGGVAMTLVFSEETF